MTLTLSLTPWLTDTRTTLQGAMRSPNMLSNATKGLRYEPIQITITRFYRRALAT